MIYGKQKKDDTYRNFKFNSIFFFFFFGSNYIALCNVMKLNDYGKIVRLD